MKALYTSIKGYTKAHTRKEKKTLILSKETNLYRKTTQSSIKRPPTLIPFSHSLSPYIYKSPTTLSQRSIIVVPFTFFNQEN